MRYDEIRSISEKLDSPSFYIFDEERFIQTYRKLEKAFQSRYGRFRIAYSFKTNYCPRIVSVVRRLGGLAEVVSDFEMEIALKAGFSPRDIVFNGPVKSVEASVRLLEGQAAAGGEVGGDVEYNSFITKKLTGGGCVVADNESEIDTLITRNSDGHRWRVGLRCNIDMDPHRISRFGVDADSVEFGRVVEKIQRNFGLEMLHCHTGGYRELAWWERRAEVMAALAKKLDVLPKAIDLGSGMFGEPEESLKAQFLKEVPTFDQYAEAVCKVFDREFGSLPEEKRPYLIVEPGTTIVANALDFYCPVASVKNIRGKSFVEVWGSIHNIGTVLAQKKNLPCSLISSCGQTRHVDDADIVGYTCLEYDSLQRGFAGDVAVGDYFEFRNTGSYSNVVKPPFIMPNFPMITYRDGKISVIKRRERPSDLYATYTFD